MILYVLPPAQAHSWAMENLHEFREVQLGRQMGRLNNGQTFMYRSAEGNWLDGLRGIRITSYKLIRNVHLTSFEHMALQAMIQR